MRPLPLSVVASSDLQRARMTADRIAAVNTGEARRVVIPGLNEIDFGSMDGISVSFYDIYVCVCIYIYIERCVCVYIYIY